MPLYILGSWALTGAEANPTNTNLVLLTAVFLGLGFAFWLAAFPFFTWAPLLSGQVRPYAAGFIFIFLPTVALLLGAAILGENGWLRNAALMLEVFRVAGGVMIITAGFWAAFERDLGRLFGYIVLAQTGFSLLALSLGNRLGQEIFVMMFLPRVIALGLWALSASVLRNNNRSLSFNDLLRAAERTPLAALGLAVSSLSLAGLPLFAEFPIRVVLLQEIAVAHPVAALFVLLGSVGLLFSAFRFLTVVTGGRLGLERRDRTPFGETRAQGILILIGIFVLLVVGVFPRVFFPVMVGILPAFGLFP
jgi:formate hydrogenlyase subunit 3/multisubunit Na+/H+ antiporter MnhD subunit